MDYHYRKNALKHQNRFRHGYKTLLIIFILFLMIGLVIGYIIWQQLKKQPITPTITGGNVQSVDVLKTVSNNDFSFRSYQVWTLSEDLSSLPNRYVYQSRDKELIERELTVYLNEIPEDTHVTYVVPVNSINQGALKVEKVSPLCGELVKTINQNPQQRTYMGSTFMCIPDSRYMIIAAVQKKGSYNVPVITLSDKQRNIGFLYRDFTANPRTDVFTEILDEFVVK